MLQAVGEVCAARRHAKRVNGSEYGTRSAYRHGAYGVGITKRVAWAAVHRRIKRETLAINAELMYAAKAASVEVRAELIVSSGT